MAVKSIIDIDIRDGRLKAVYDLMQKYNAAIKSSRAAWALVNNDIDGSRASYKKMVDQMVAANVQAKLRERAEETAYRRTRSMSDIWKTMARDTREFTSNITGATTQLLKWASVTGVIGGLIGAGGLFGIDRLALGAANSRRSALGIGAGIGGQEAFKTNFSRFVDPDSFLSAVSGAKFDITKRTGLLGAGLTDKEIGGDTSDTAVALLRKLKTIADTTNPALYAQVLQARRLDQFAGPETLNRLRVPGELEKMIGQFGQRRAQFDLPADTAEKWQNFVTQLDNAGKDINTIFVKGLVNLAPGLSKLSESVEKIATTMFEKGGPLEQWVGKIDVALEKFATYIGTEEFQKNIRDFVNGIGRIAAAIGGVATYFGKGEDLGGKGVRDRARWSKIHGEGRQTAGEMRRDRANGTTTALGQLGHILFGNANSLSQDQLLAMVEKREGGTDGKANPWGAVGRYQIKPSTAQEFGIDPASLWNKAGNEAAARKILAAYAKKYHGNVTEVLAAYNQGTGAGNVFARSGDNPATLKPEGQKYINGTQGMKVQIENNTGGNAIISTNALKN